MRWPIQAAKTRALSATVDVLAEIDRCALALRDPCVYRNPTEKLVGWRDDRTTRFRAGRPDLAVQVEVAA
jgi:hypothetical protein